MPRFSIIVISLLLAFILATPAADAGTNIAREVAQALKLAKHADKTAKAALAASKRGTKGATGAQGPSGAAGLNGSDGSNGSIGPKGTKGDTGQAGQDATANVAATSSQNAADVTLGTPFSTSAKTIAHVVLVSSVAGRIVVQADGEITNPRYNANDGGQAAPVTCRIEIDATTVESRDFDLDALARQLVTISTVADLGVGTHDVALVCQRTNGVADSQPVFPVQRSRLTALSA